VLRQAGGALRVDEEASIGMQEVVPSRNADSARAGTAPVAGTSRRSRSCHCAQARHRLSLVLFRFL
jgi:hypothetical protein